MILIVCLDNNDGMMFNSRRQSRDKRLIEDIEKNSSARIHVNEYSAMLFDNEYIQINKDPFAACNDGEFVFCENLPLPDIESFEKIIVYRWNKVYPEDMFFPFDLKGLNLIETYDFEGTSHDKITKEVYINEK